jgi:sperm-associated antigen 16 protein
VSCDSDGVIKVWDIRMVKEQTHFDMGVVSANCAIFDKSGQKVFVAAEDKVIRVFNLTTGAKEGELKGHEEAVLDLCWDHGKENYLVSASADCSFRIWQ